MKRSIWVVLVLFILGAGVLCFTAVGMDMRKDDVTIEEKTLYGDKTALEGLHLEMNTNAQELMFWHIRYEPETGQIGTEFRFGHQYAKNVNYGGFSQGIWFTLQPHNITWMGASGDNSNDIKEFAELYETEGFSDEVEQIVTGIADRTKPGEEHTEYVYLKDYCEVYPLSVEINLRVGVGDTDKGIDPYLSFMEDCREYFRIPVDEEYRLEFSVRKDSQGRIQEISLSNDTFEQSYQDVENFTLATEYGCYFAIQRKGTNQEVLDTSMMQGEYGVCYIPYVDNEGQEWAYFDNMQVIYGMDESMYLEQMALSKDGSKVYLLMQESGILKFIMIDARTAEILQEIPLILFGETDIVDLTYEYDAFIAVNINGAVPRILVIEKSEENRYEHVLTAVATDIVDMGVGLSWDYYGYDNGTEWTDARSNTTMAWDGERLAVASFAGGDYYFPCSFHLAVYDRTGLLYCGSHINSLDILRNCSGYNSSNLCRPDEVDTWFLSWK